MNHNPLITFQDDKTMKNVPNCSNRKEYNYRWSLLLPKLVLPFPNLKYPKNYPKMREKKLRTGGIRSSSAKIESDTEGFDKP